MASHAAIAAVTRSIRTLLLDRMTTGAAVTVAPPDVTVADVDGARVNLYLFQVLENAGLKNQEIPGHGHPAAYGRPPLPLNLRYLMTTHSAIETQAEAEINAQIILGDAMRVLHGFGNRIDDLTVVNAIAGTPGDPILDPVLADEFERVKIVLHPASLDDLTKVWSALSEKNFRRSVIYEATVVQIENPEPRVRPLPVATRRVMATVRRRPVIHAAYVTPPPNGPLGEFRARIGDEITILAEHALADRLYVRLGNLEPIRVPPPGDGRIRVTVPDAQYPADLDHPAVRPIPLAARLQPGSLEIRVVAEHPIDGVAGGLDHGAVVSEPRRFTSNVALMQLVPRVTGATPASGTAADVLKLTGTRLWHPAARVAEVVIADAAIAIRPPEPGDPWAAPTDTAVEIPLVEVGVALPTLAPADDPYPVAVQVDGARSRDAGIGFRLVP